MKAFLSHSSIDKPFVEQVYSKLGAAQAHYDASTFEKAVLNVDAIRKALIDSDLFVLFLSENSTDSSFVSHESKIAFEALAAGILKRVLILCIDNVSLDIVPSFLKDLNIVTQISSPGASYRRIQSLLVDLRIDHSETTQLFVGREAETKALAAELTKPSDESPAIISVAGHSGMGRRTIIKKVMRDIMPSFATYLHVEMGRGAGIDDFFMALLRGRGRSTIFQIVSEMRNFNAASIDEKINTITMELSRIMGENETLIIEDAGGLLDDDGRFPNFMLKSIAPIYDEIRPVAYFVQVRMPPSRIRQSYSRVSFIRVPPLSSHDAKTLVGAKLKRAKIRYDANDLTNLTNIVDGHPVNIDFAVSEILNYNSDIKLFLKKPTELTAWKSKRAADYISSLVFNDVDNRVILTLLLFRFLPTDLMLEIVDVDSDSAVDSIKRLQDWHVIEYHNGVYSISLPLFDALERDMSISLSKRFEKNASRKVLSYIEKYKDDDEISIALVEPAVIASLRAGASAVTSQWRQLILPSHYLAIAREAYNNADYEGADNFCDRALEQIYRMSRDAKVEALRLKGLCAVRRRNTVRFNEAVSELARIRNRHASSVQYFLEGFIRRNSGDLIGAEEKYLKCYDKNEKSFHVCRELSQVYLSLSRHGEAETYARSAYAIAPTNAYVIDILVGILLGKSTDANILSRNSEFVFLMNELKKYGDGEGKSFYSRRQAEFMLRMGDHRKARDWADTAVSQTPHLILPYFIRATIQIQRKNFNAAERDLKAMNALLRDPDSEEGSQYAIEILKIELDLKIVKRQYRQAFNMIERNLNKLPHYLIDEIKEKLAEAIRYDGNFHDPDLIEWAKRR